MAAGHDGPTIRVLLLGKTGSGKSTVGNALLGGENKFHVGRGLMSETKRTAWDRAVRKSIMFEVTDTPGLCDTNMSKWTIYKELAKSVAVAKPGPNIILFFLRVDHRFTEDERHAYETIKKLFSEEISKYVIFVFNAIDEFGWQLPIDAQKRALKRNLLDIKREQSESGKAMATMLTEAEERYIGLNNRTSADEQQTQIQDLVNMMLDLVRKNGGAFYSTELTQVINRRVDEMMQGEQEIHERLINEDVPEGFFDMIVEIIRRAFQGISRSASKLCAVM